MSDTSNNTDALAALSAEHDALTAEYQAAWTVWHEAVSQIPADASLVDLDARRAKAHAITQDAAANQAAISDKMAKHADRATAWASERVVADTSGLDSTDNAALRRVLDRALATGDETRALAAASTLSADGDHTALSAVSAAFPEVGTALSILDTYATGPDADLAAMSYMRATMPDDDRIRPNFEAARTIQKRQAEQRAAEAAELEARRQSYRPRSAGTLRSDESRTRGGNTPVPGGGRGGRGAVGR